MKYIYFFAVVASISLTSCKTTNIFEDKYADNSVEALPEVFTAKDNYQYHIRKDDKITIGIWGQDDLSVGSTYGIYNSNEVYGKWLMVDTNGNIEIPKIGTFYVKNMTIVALKDTLKTVFAEWIKNPVLDVKVLNREITILGEVLQPQIVTVDKEQNTLLDLIARSKGFDFYANKKNIKVLRQVGNDVYVANIDLTIPGNYLQRNINLYPGDVVIVPSKKSKNFDRKIANIIPFATTVTAAALLMGLL